MVIPSILEHAHTLAGRAVEEGGVAVDATVGNGHDTAFLARAVGPDGSVVGFDVQEKALAEARECLEAEAPAASVRLVHAGHQTLARHLDEAKQGRVGAIMFNLGYLPGGDHSITTRPETTRQALKASAEVLRPGGVITTVAYTGHEGGKAEAEAVETWVSALPQEQFRALSYRFPNWSNDPPRLFAVEKRRDA
ncbi:class I SAM-dependent methyltransferase [Salinibacter grassmerensis]|uniref:class I SAM-dependent methyltransferase n=1 Tax=Salinibacter grassmerensis TaxID=3040353 RepID=UPI0021E83BBD|nr:class I SAM-dependent methyltransferase [Salinibacter grassmerensis]